MRSDWDQARIRQLNDLNPHGEVSSDMTLRRTTRSKMDSTDYVGSIDERPLRMDQKVLDCLGLKLLLGS